MWFKSDIKKSISWDDSHSELHYVLTLEDYEVECPFSDIELQESIDEILTMANQ